MTLPAMLEPAWQRALKDAVRPLIPPDFHGHITINVKASTLADINVYITLKEPKPVAKQAERW